MRRPFFVLLIVAVCAVAILSWGLSVSARPKTITWVGTVSFDWGDPQNWSPNKVPVLSTDDVIIPPAIQLPSLDQDRRIHSLEIEDSAAVFLNGHNLTLDGILTNRGTIRVFCDENLTAIRQENPGTWEYVGYDTAHPCRIRSEREQRSIVLLSQDESMVFEIDADIGLKESIWVKNGIFDLRGYSVSAGSVINDAVVRLRGNERIDAAMSGKGTWRIVGISNDRSDVIVLKTRKFQNIVIDASPPFDTFIFQEGTSIAGTFTMRQGSVLFETTAPLAVKGALIVEGGTINARGPVGVSGPLRLTGGLYIFSFTGEQLFQEIVLAGGSFRGTAAVGKVTIAGNLTLGSGSFVSPPLLSVGGNIIKGKAAFDPRLGTVTLAGKNQQIQGSISFFSLTKKASAKDTLTIKDGSKLTVKGTLILQGTAAQPLALRSSAVGRPWFIDASGKQTISNVDVKDSRNVGKKQISCQGTCKNSGNVIGWSALQKTP